MLSNILLIFNFIINCVAGILGILILFNRASHRRLFIIIMIALLVILGVSSYPKLTGRHFIYPLLFYSSWAFGMTTLVLSMLSRKIGEGANHFQR